jgi:hypothetical protein
MNTLEKEFYKNMINIYNELKRELNYNSTKFLQLLSEEGGVRTAKRLINKEGVTYGFEVLWENNRLDLSVEAVVAYNSKYKDLFTEEEIKNVGKSLKITDIKKIREEYYFV